MSAKDVVIDEKGYINEAMQRKYEEIMAEIRVQEKKPKLQGTVIPINPNTRVIKRG